MRTYITTANYLKLHKIFLCFENKYEQTGKTVSKTYRAVIRDAIEGAAIAAPLKHIYESYFMLQK